MGFGRTEKERELVLIASSRSGERLKINDNFMVRSNDDFEYHDPSKSMIYSFYLEDFDRCEIYIRVEFFDSEGNLSLIPERRTIDRYIDGQVVYYKGREQHGEEIRSVRGIN